jgi:23S rRNA (uridine2552-2'-O)-methyltransferase
VVAYTRKDRAYLEAKRSGLRSRAALKLIELDDKFHLFASGARVLDLGCWPGGWLQVAAQRVGPTGRVVGIDREPTGPLGLDRVTVIAADAADAAAAEQVRSALGGAADVLLSDMAPKLSGIRVADRERHTALVALACTWARDVLVSDGRALIKLFQDVEVECAALLRRTFADVALHRPPSTRKGSSEIYAIARRLKPAR